MRFVAHIKVLVYPVFLPQSPIIWNVRVALQFLPAANYQFRRTLGMLTACWKRYNVSIINVPIFLGGTEWKVIFLEIHSQKPVGYFTP